MKIVVDADACPVKNEIVKIAKRSGLEVIMVCDTSHVITSDYAKVITVDKGADSVDFALINMVKAGDIVVSQDYGVAAMALAKRAFAIGNFGKIYTQFNIDAMLNQRYLAKENRRKGGKFMKGPKAPIMNKSRFTESLLSLIANHE
ncbi:MAG: YaiI/YqxD family protein [Clostridiales bacterium]|nr:YaiI/YqxD family protein [Clostridiales bacterium]